MTQHTPGPWLSDSRWPNCIVAPKAIEGPLSLARVCEYRYLSDADRLLIAAAPDMLEACRKSSNSTHHPACPITTGKGHTTITRDDCTCHVGIARAAIAKAIPHPSPQSEKPNAFPPIPNPQINPH